jgi:DNA-binding HxlR family transcriptional regulator
VVRKARINEAAAFVISAKIAKALADVWRSRILMELSVRPLSPSQFVDEIGGETSEIGRCFRQLAAWGYIEVIETRTGLGQRQGGVEHVYRGIQRAHFDTSVWEGLSPPHRKAFSGSILESYVARITEAVAAGTFDDELDRHLSWDGAQLDRLAWTQLGMRLDQILDWLPVLAAEASRRMAKSGEEPIPTTVGLAAFRSPGATRLAMPPRFQAQELVDVPEVSPFVISAKMAKAVANKWRSRILMELRIRPMSPIQFVNEIGGSQRNINRCFQQLAEWDYIQIVDEHRTGGRRHGPYEKIYGLKQRAHFDTRTWEELPRFLRDEFSASILHSYFARIAEAIEAGTFDAESDRHLSWDGVALDRVAWAQLIAAADEVLHWLSTLEEEAGQRMAESGEKPIPTIIGLAVFRSPVSSEITSDMHRANRKQDLILPQ